ncbi:MAG TPA: adenylate kinase [Actinomycetota bacterium]|nr:adenylate kinase [Actinomycetota bacterium]
MQIVLLGVPGAGKGTQAHRLADRFGLEQIATGDIFRWNVQNGTDLGVLAKQYMDAGELVPDDVVVQMVVQALGEAPDGFILDGFPRTIAQAEALDQELTAEGKPLSVVMAFELPDEVAVKRLAGRRTCARCQRTYNVEFHTPKVEGRCDVCDGELVHRDDDSEGTVRHRIEVYYASTAPLRDFYEERRLLRVVDADGTEDEVTDRAVEALADLPSPA